MLAVLDRLERQADAGFRIAGRLDDDVDVRERDQRLGVRREMSSPRLDGVGERGRRVRFRRPARRLELTARAVEIEIGEADEMQAGRHPRLGQKHRAELAGADQSDPDRPAGGLPLHQHGVEIHETALVRAITDK